MSRHTLGTLLAGAVAAGLIAACGSTGATPTAKTVTPRRAASVVPLLNRHKKKVADNEGPEKPSTKHALAAVGYRFTLRGRNEVPGVPIGSTRGQLTITPRTHRLCWQFGRLPGQHVSTAAFGSVQEGVVGVSAEIRSGVKGSTGRVLLALGPKYEAHGCTVVAPVVMNSVIADSHAYYVNVVTARHPRGALRSQL